MSARRLDGGDHITMQESAMHTNTSSGRVYSYSCSCSCNEEEQFRCHLGHLLESYSGESFDSISQVLFALKATRGGR